MRILSSSCALLALLASLAAQDREVAPKDTTAAVTAERLQAAYDDAVAACCKVLDVRFDEPIPLQLVTPAELAKAIAAENLPSIRLRQPDAAKAKAEANQLGKQLSQFVYAKYAWSTHTFMVAASTWESAARELRLPELTGDETMRAVMVHELCHALDDRRFGLGKLVLGASSMDAITAINAVIEGHAQLQARRVCAKSGWSRGFATMRDVVGKLPESLAESGEAVLMLARIQAAAATFAYHDGERFVQAVTDALKDKAAERLFGQPPQDADTILQPKWYLDPKSRPALLFDPEPALDVFAKRFDPATWTERRLNATGKQIASGLTLLDEKDVAAFVAALRSARVLTLNPTKRPDSKLAIVVVMEMDSEAAAQRWIEVSDELSKRKDAAMRKGELQVTDSTTTKIEEPTCRGFLQEKTMKAGSREFAVASIDLQRGRIVVETVLSVEPMAMEEHIALVKQMLDAVKRRP